MTRWPLLLLLVAACGGETKDARTKQCEEIYDRMAKAAADLGAELGSHEKQVLMKQCREIPEERLPCLEDPSLPICGE